MQNLHPIIAAAEILSGRRLMSRRVKGQQPAKNILPFLDSPLNCRYSTVDGGRSSSSLPIALAISFFPSC